MDVASLFSVRHTVYAGVTIAICKYWYNYVMYSLRLLQVGGQTCASCDNWGMQSFVNSGLPKMRIIHGDNNN